MEHTHLCIWDTRPRFDREVPVHTDYVANVIRRFPYAFTHEGGERCAFGIDYDWHDTCGELQAVVIEWLGAFGIDLVNVVNVLYDSDGTVYLERRNLSGITTLTYLEGSGISPPKIWFQSGDPYKVTERRSRSEVAPSPEIRRTT